MERFGAPRNFNAERPESLLISAAKKPGRWAQKRHHSSMYEMQVDFQPQIFQSNLYIPHMLGMQLSFFARRIMTQQNIALDAVHLIKATRASSPSHLI